MPSPDAQPLTASVASASCPQTVPFCLQLLKQTRGNPDTASAVRAWQLFLLTAASAPPSKEYLGLVSEYVHSVSQNEAGIQSDVRSWALRTWAALKRSTKAGTRRYVSACTLNPCSLSRSLPQLRPRPPACVPIASRLDLLSMNPHTPCLLHRFTPAVSYRLGYKPV